MTNPLLLLARLLVSTIASLITYSVWKGCKLAWRRYRSPLRHLQGPKGKSFVLGSLMEVQNDEDAKLTEEWVKKYGQTLKFKSFLNRDDLLTVDTRAINHILTHSNDYQKPPTSREVLADIFGEGLLVVEGTEHRQQRRIMNPAFGPAQIRVLTDTFLSKASRLCDLLSFEIEKEATEASACACIDIIPWLNRVTLDIIGLTGFNYDFNSLDSNGQPNELREAFATMFSATQNVTVLDILQGLIPILRIIPNAETRKIRAAKKTMIHIGQELLTNAKAAVLAGETGKREVDEKGLHGRDLLSLLVKANMATDIPESQKLSDEDVIFQVPTFFVAGHETTSAAVTWALYAMTKALGVQTKLRDELLSVDTDTPSMDELMALPYLDGVVKETLRLHAPVPDTSRIAMKNDVLPVEKPYVDRYGAVRDTITISKGDQLIIPILTINRSKELWGPDAHEFKPERWNHAPEAVSQVPGVWGHLLTFIGGPRACIGFRFSVVEFKAILFALVRAFEFELAVPLSEIRSRTAIVQRPVLRNDPTYQAQLPLLIRSYQRS